jgi:hypothetical protein
VRVWGQQHSCLCPGCDCCGCIPFASQEIVLLDELVHTLQEEEATLAVELKNLQVCMFCLAVFWEGLRIGIGGKITLSCYHWGSITLCIRH